MSETTETPETPETPKAPEASTPATEAPAPVVETLEAPVIKPVGKPRELPKGQRWWNGTGRRKRAVARVRIRPGKGEFKVNKRDLDKYFCEERDRNDINAVLDKTSTRGALDIYVNVAGGGFMGQAGAIVLGVARALKNYDEGLEPILRENAFLTRDDRKVERKKPGQKGARARFQFSKR